VQNKKNLFQQAVLNNMQFWNKDTSDVTTVQHEPIYVSFVILENY